MNIGSAIKEIRKARGLTQIELADKMNMAVNSIRLYESGKRIPSITVRVSLSEALDCSLYDLMDKKEIEAFKEAAEVGYWAREEEEAELESLIEEAEALINDCRDIDLLAAFRKLNTDGQRVAVERVQELTLIPQYQRIDTNTPHTTEKPSESE